MGRKAAALKRLTRGELTGALIILAAGMLYLLTLDNGLRPDELIGGDLITHQYAQLEARPSNAPGYPLYTMGGWLWFRLGRLLLKGLLNPIQILSFYSTLWGLSALLLLYLILYRQIRLPWLPALLLTAFQATTFFFWYYSVTTEQYTSAVCQTLLLIWLAFRWDDTPRNSLLILMAFVSGTMLANMVTTLFVLPPLLWFIFSKRVRSNRGSETRMLTAILRRPALIFKGIGAAALPLLSYGYIFIRGAQYPEWRGAGQWTTTWEWFIQFLTIQQGRDELGPGLNLQPFFTDEFPALIGWELTWPVLLGGMLGLIYLERRRAIFLAATLLIYLIFCWGYRFGNWFQVIIPAYPLFIIGFAAGLDRLRQRLISNPTASTMAKKLPLAAIILLLIGLVAYRFSTSLPRANQHNRPADTGLEPGWAILADNPAESALIYGAFEERLALEYLQAAWGVAPKLNPIDVDRFVPPSEIASQKTYISRQAVAARSETIPWAGLYPRAAGAQLIALSPTPLTQLPSSATPIAVSFGQNLSLIAWEEDYPDSQAQPPASGPPRQWQLTLYWQASAEMSHDYTISIRPRLAGQPLVDENGPLIQDHQPVWGVYPTSRWRPGEVVRDLYTFPLDIRPDGLQVVVYRTTESGFENLALHNLELERAQE